MTNLAKIVKNSKPFDHISIGRVITSIAYYCKVLKEDEPIYRVVEPEPTKVTLNQLVTGKALRKEGNKYFSDWITCNVFAPISPSKI
jgi:ubiquinone/menaquinone biosynthesis C-methylase UbiE